MNLDYPPSKDEYMDAVFELNLQQHVLQPTRDNANFDLIFSDSLDLMSNIDIIEPLGTSDHNMTLCELEAPLSAKKTFESFDYQKADWLYYQELFHIWAS